MQGLDVVVHEGAMYLFKLCLISAKKKTDKALMLPGSGV